MLLVRLWIVCALFLSMTSNAVAQDSGINGRIWVHDRGGDYTTSDEKWNITRYERLLVLNTDLSRRKPLETKWEHAFEFCKQTFGGRSDWHLPNRTDLSEHFRKSYIPKDGFWTWLSESGTAMFISADTLDNPRVTVPRLVEGRNRIEGYRIEYITTICVADVVAPPTVSVKKEVQAGAKPGAAANKTNPKVNNERQKLADQIEALNSHRTNLELTSPGSPELKRANAEYKALLSRQARESKAQTSQNAGAQPAPLPQEKTPNSNADKKLYVFESARTFKSPISSNEANARRWVVREMAEATGPFAVYSLSHRLLNENIDCAELESKKFQCSGRKVWEVKSYTDPNAKTKGSTSSNGVSR